MQAPGFNLFMFQIISPIGHYPPHQPLFPGDGGRRHGNACSGPMLVLFLMSCLCLCGGYLSVFHAPERCCSWLVRPLLVPSMLMYGAVVFGSARPAEQTLSHSTVLDPCRPPCVLKGRHTVCFPPHTYPIKGPFVCRRILNASLRGRGGFGGFSHYCNSVM